MKKSVLVLALLLGACSSDTTGLWMTGYAGEAAKVEPGHPLDLGVAERSRLRQNDLLTVTVELTNTLKKDQTVQWQFSWFDGQGQAVAVDGQPWQPITLHGHQSRTVTATAPNPSVVSYRLAVREVLKESY
jgi:uncharacterized protein YcfL